MLIKYLLMSLSLSATPFIFCLYHYLELCKKSEIKQCKWTARRHFYIIAESRFLSSLLPAHTLRDLPHVTSSLASRYSAASYIPARVILKTHSSHRITLFKKSSVGMQLLSQELLRRHYFPLLMFLPGGGSVISRNVPPCHLPRFTRFSSWVTEGGNSLSHWSHREVTLASLVHHFLCPFFREQRACTKLVFV